MDSMDSFHFNSGGSSTAVTSSMETGEETLAQIKEKLMLGDVKRRMPAGNVEFSGTGRRISISDLVWCKAVCQPWWPGKVIGDSIALREGDECLGSDSYLVLRFGNNSFEWYDARNVKAFWENFPRMARRGSTASFREAVSCALEEVSRRVRYTLACRCMKEWTCRDVGRSRWTVDDDVMEGVILSTASFVPRELIDYIKGSSKAASYGDDGLVREVAKAQLFALFFWRNRSRELPVYASLFAEPEEDDHMQDIASRYHTPNSVSSSKEAGYPDDVGFIFSDRPTDKGKGEDDVNDPDKSLARGTKGLLLKESGDVVVLHVDSTEMDLMMETKTTTLNRLSDTLDQ